MVQINKGMGTDEVLSVFIARYLSLVSPLVGFGAAQEYALLRVVVWCLCALYFLASPVVYS